jgi:hypothetical protein
MPANHKKTELLGMPFGTAGGRLRKMVMFHLLKKHQENICFKCGKVIEEVAELSIEHKESWQLGGPHLYWDLDNIAFSHLKCNRRSVSRPGSGRSRRKVGPEGTAWCTLCQAFLPVEAFYRNRYNWNGYNNRCIACMKRTRPKRVQAGKVKAAAPR